MQVTAPPRCRRHQVEPSGRSPWLAAAARPSAMPRRGGGAGPPCTARRGGRGAPAGGAAPERSAAQAHRGPMPPPPPAFPPAAPAQCGGPAAVGRGRGVAGASPARRGARERGSDRSASLKLEKTPRSSSLICEHHVNYTMALRPVLR